MKPETTEHSVCVQGGLEIGTVKRVGTHWVAYYRRWTLQSEDRIRAVRWVYAKHYFPDKTLNELEPYMGGERSIPGVEVSEL